MSSEQNPIALLNALRERAMGVFYKHPVTVPVQVVGVDLGHSHMIVMAIEKKIGKPQITHFRVEPRPSTLEEASGRLRQIFKEEGLQPHSVRAALKSEGIVIRILDFPQMKKSEMESMLRYEVEKYIPFKANDVILDFQILNENVTRGNMKSMEILLVAVKQTEVHQLLNLFQKAGLEVELIDIGAFAFANLLEFAFPETLANPLAFLDMGRDSSTFGIMLHGKPIFIRDVSFGGSDILKFLKRKLSLDAEASLAFQKNPSSAPSEYKTVVVQALAGLVNELKLSIGYYLDHVVGAEPLQILFVMGGGFRFIESLDYLEKECKIPARRPDILSKMDMDERLDRSLLKNNEDLLASVLGLCLR